jgi:hypothetical protein
MQCGSYHTHFVHVSRAHQVSYFDVKGDRWYKRPKVKPGQLRSPRGSQRARLTTRLDNTAPVGVGPGQTWQNSPPDSGTTEAS